MHAYSFLFVFIFWHLCTHTHACTYLFISYFWGCVLLIRDILPMLRWAIAPISVRLNLWLGDDGAIWNRRNRSAGGRRLGDSWHFLRSKIFMKELEWLRDQIRCLGKANHCLALLSDVRHLPPANFFRRSKCIQFVLSSLQLPCSKEMKDPDLSRGALEPCQQLAQHHQNE